MSDREFDKQFRDAFEDFEVQPSPLAWGKISNGLDASGKRAFPYTKVAAAAVAALVTAGLWLGPRKEPLKLYGKTRTVEEALVADQRRSISSADTEIAKVDADETLAFYPVAEKRTPKAKQGRERAAFLSENADTVQSRSGRTYQKEPEKRIETSEPAVYETLALASEEQRAPLQHEVNADTASDRSKSRIRSVGDLVNFVVRKVDKRKNKIIEFSRDDEGEEISGLNLGLLQYRTRNN